MVLISIFDIYTFRCSTIILQGLILVDFADGIWSAKISSSRKKYTNKIKTCKNNRTFILIFALRRRYRSFLLDMEMLCCKRKYLCDRLVIDWNVWEALFRLILLKKSNKSWKYYITFLSDVSLLEKETAKTSSQGKFSQFGPQKICSRKPQKSPIRKIKVPQTFHVTRYSKTTTFHNSPRYRYHIIAPSLALLKIVS